MQKYIHCYNTQPWIRTTRIVEWKNTPFILKAISPTTGNIKWDIRIMECTDPKTQQLPLVNESIITYSHWQIYDCTNHSASKNSQWKIFSLVLTWWQTVANRVHPMDFCIPFWCSYGVLYHLLLDKMAAVSQVIFWYAFLCIQFLCFIEICP